MLNSSWLGLKRVESDAHRHVKRSPRLVLQPLVQQPRSDGGVRLDDVPRLAARACYCMRVSARAARQAVLSQASGQVATNQARCWEAALTGCISARARKPPTAAVCMPHALHAQVHPNLQVARNTRSGASRGSCMHAASNRQLTACTPAIRDLPRSQVA